MGKYDRVGRFRMVSGDINPLDYGALWGWQVPGTQRFHFVEVFNWEDAVGARDAEGLPRYNVKLTEVDLESVSTGQIERAMSSSGIELDTPEPHWIPGTPATQHMWARAAALSEYGAEAPILDESGDNWRKLFRAAAQASLDVAADATRLDRGACNRIGSTPREMMRGDIASGLARGVSGGDTATNIIARMYQSAGYQTLGGELPADQAATIESALREKADG